MNVKVSVPNLSRTSEASSSLRLALCACLASIAAMAEGARFDDFGGARSGPIDNGTIVGESVLVPDRQTVVDESIGYPQGFGVQGVQSGSVIVNDGGQPGGGPCFSREPECHPGILAALYDHHLGRVAERDAAGLPRNSTTGLVNRVLGPACPRWTAQADALFLWQQPLDSRVLFTYYGPSDNPIDGAPAYNTNQVRSEMGIGPRVALILHLDCVDAVEANYFNVGGLGGSGQLPRRNDGLSDFYAQNDLVGYNFADVYDASVVATTGAIQSFELNWRRWNRGAFTWLVGARWVEWNESLSIVDSYELLPGEEGAGTDSFDVLTRNDLYGGQIGTDVLLWNAHKIVRFNGVCKAGVFYNGSASQRTTVMSDREPDSPIDVSASGTHTAFFGEVGINGSVKLTEWLSWRAGYNFFWISGVAVSSRQLSATDIGTTPPTTVVNMNGSVMLHGANTGLEARW